MVALLHGAHAAHARILVREAPHQVVQQALAHGAFRLANPVDAEVLDDFQENRQPGGKHRGALGIHVLEIEFIHVPRRDHPFGERAQIIESDARAIRD